ncbi:MAG TPA: nitrous oxide reductase family maturation protein NosD, partial [Thermoanaerobaculia bacterium]|nr:nitrous oxide reductase family maturation protein NosD [Thermoanaerobaculia bacterium]
IDHPLHLIGRGRPKLIGSGSGSVISIRAPHVTVEGFDIDGQGGGDLAEDPSGIHIAAKHATVRDCRIERSLFGIYLREANNAVVQSCSIRGIREKDPGEKGSGIHVWNTNGFTLTGNTISDVRDGLYIQASSNGMISRNEARDLRYGLHYMFSDDNVFEDNTFSDGAAGAALMYSRRIIFRRNRFVHNRGFASVGLLLKACDDTLAEDNLIADNARGIFVEGSSRNIFRRNIVASSDMALVLYDSIRDNRFEGNSFVANMTPLMFAGRRTDTNLDGNFWSDNDEPDLDGNGRTDRPYRLSTVFDHFRGNLSAADLFSDSLAAKTLGAAERLFPVLEDVPVVDHSPLARTPHLPRVPSAPPRRHRANAAGIASSFLALGCGALVLTRARQVRP